jgi:hypothetical protein
VPLGLLPSADPIGAARWDATARFDWRLHETTTIGFDTNLRERPWSSHRAHRSCRGEGVLLMRRMIRSRASRRHGMAPSLGAWPSSRWRWAVCSRRSCRPRHGSTCEGGRWRVVRATRCSRRRCGSRATAPRSRARSPTRCSVSRRRAGMRPRSRRIGRARRSVSWSRSSPVHGSAGARSASMSRAEDSLIVLRDLAWPKGSPRNPRRSRGRSRVCSHARWRRARVGAVGGHLIGMRIHRASRWRLSGALGPA